MAVEPYEYDDWWEDEPGLELLPLLWPAWFALLWVLVEPWVAPVECPADVLCDELIFIDEKINCGYQ